MWILRSNTLIDLSNVYKIGLTTSAKMLVIRIFYKGTQDFDDFYFDSEEERMTYFEEIKKILPSPIHSL